VFKAVVGCMISNSVPRLIVLAAINAFVNPGRELLS